MLIEAFQKIVDRRLVWRPVPAVFGIEGYFCACGSHFVYWRVGKANQIRIVAILHQRMHQVDRLRQALGDD